MYFIRVTEGKNEKRRQSEDCHLKFHLHSTRCLPKGIHQILTHVVAEKSLKEKDVNMYYIRVIEGKNEKSKKEGKIRISIQSTLCLPTGVHKILKHWL